MKAFLNNDLQYLNLHIYFLISKEPQFLGRFYSELSAATQTH